MTVVERLESIPHAPRTRARRLARRWGVAGVALAVAAPLAAAAAPADASRGGDHHRRPAFRQVNLVSDLHSVHAKIVDRNVKNPWGIALGPDTPLWVNNNFNPAQENLCDTCVPEPADLLTKITIYSGANGHDPFAKVPLEVTASSPTGMVFNPTMDFVVDQGGAGSVRQGSAWGVRVLAAPHGSPPGDGLRRGPGRGRGPGPVPLRRGRGERRRRAPCQGPRLEQRP